MKDYKGEVQYVRYYTAGSAAPKLASRSEKKPKVKYTRTVPKPVRRVRLLIDPFALVGTVIAVVMAVCVLVGFLQVNRANQTVAAMESHIAAVQAENRALAEEFEAGYDMEEVKTVASAMGLVPEDAVRHIRVHVEEPVPQPEPGFWAQLWEDLQELFA